MPMILRNKKKFPNFLRLKNPKKENEKEKHKKENDNSLNDAGPILYENPTNLLTNLYFVKYFLVCGKPFISYQKYEQENKTLN
ncbi:hypothetical protein BpHYR1_025343 [Brachionus plicatilis]|uniref:Uncharacterized protein n=1 Tax=Brachionus plicatilis TaxID=10195 RepID=A0A3M7RJM1_BRAPC|nr:hypothetical protein BpHYR1_025343 [Brachionus plicatilis]